MTVPGSVVVRRAEVEGRIVEVRIVNGIIDAIGASLPGADVEVDAAGGAVLPGLHDHHLHLLAMAAARLSLDVAPLTDAASFDRALEATMAPGNSGWLRVVGYHEAVHGALDRDRLDRLMSPRPVRVQHATGAMWVLNSAAFERLDLVDVDDPVVERGADGRTTGRLYGGDHLVRRAEIDANAVVASLDEVAADLAAWGITGVTDLTPTDDATSIDLLASRARRPEFPVDVVITGGLDLPASAGPDLARGPVKLLVADHAFPDPDQLAAAIATAHDRGRRVACHCASEIGLALALGAWRQAGAQPGDRVEHGAVIPPPLLHAVRELGLVVITQPGFVAARGDRYLGTIEPREHDDLWRCGSLIAAGIGVAAGSDAPYGPADPWLAMATAVDRRTRQGRRLGAAERIEPHRALRLYQGSFDAPEGPARRVEAGAPPRLCVLDRPLDQALANLGDVSTVGTFGRAGWSPAASSKRSSNRPR